jgi:hypothetical protein
VAVMGTLFAAVMHSQLTTQVLTQIPDSLAGLETIEELASGQSQRPHLDMEQLLSAIDQDYPSDSQAHQSAVAAAKNLEHGFRATWSQSMSAIFWAQALVVLLGLVVTVFIPETRLKPRGSIASA